MSRSVAPAALSLPSTALYDDKSWEFACVSAGWGLRGFGLKRSDEECREPQSGMKAVQMSIWAGLARNIVRDMYSPVYQGCLNRGPPLARFPSEYCAEISNNVVLPSEKLADAYPTFVSLHPWTSDIYESERDNIEKWRPLSAEAVEEKKIAIYLRKKPSIDDDSYCFDAYARFHLYDPRDMDHVPILEHPYVANRLMTIPAVTSFEIIDQYAGYDEDEEVACFKVSNAGGVTVADVYWAFAN